MVKRNIMLIIAGLMLLALFVPSAMAADYQNNGQFIAYYDSDKVSNGVSDDAATTYYNEGMKMASANAIATLQSVSSNDWPQFMYNAANVGSSPSTGLVSNNQSVTSLDVNAIGTVNPVIADGHIFVLTGYSGFDEPSGLTQIYLTCIDESTHLVEWNFPLPRDVHYGSWSSPATDGTYVYAVSDNKVYCVNVATGNEVWDFTTIGSVICNGGPTIGGSHVFCSDWSGNYYCLDKDDGELNWIFNNTCTQDYDMTYSQGTPAYDPAGYVYLTGYGYSDGDQAGELYKVDVSTGQEVWGIEETGRGEFCGSASIDGDYVYVTSYSFSGNGALYKFSKSDGTRQFRKTIERTDATPAIDSENGLIYVSGGWNGGEWGRAAPGVRCYYTNGTLKWSRLNEDMGGWTCSVALADGYAFVGKESGDMSTFCYNTTYALNAETGATEWFYPAGGATAAIANGNVYTIGNDGNLYIFG
ncbi:outer membrane protein assembly factor BamB [Methanomicrobium sp. W14]|uniref:outer membrane protein assembly factor BamB family protein n=1 Tax=Methanomicrobium sp. W14 TaxID=2817839 RepID=UPI001AEA1B79|nr:PQQ-binding-like beta-propeller repeat protein [Methanomicrobium sp. W14]MBP2133472.1 outer membrane protein assembly factor BamB [Methanomicrobium sp. W14]